MTLRGKIRDGQTYYQSVTLDGVRQSLDLSGSPCRGYRPPAPDGHRRPTQWNAFESPYSVYLDQVTFTRAEIKRNRADLVGRAAPPATGGWQRTGARFRQSARGHWSPITWLDVQVADVNGDGRADIVGRTNAGDWWVAKANDTGTGFVNERWGHWAPVTWQDVHVADVNGDGRADIVGRTECGRVVGGESQRDGHGVRQ